MKIEKITVCNECKHSAKHYYENNALWEFNLFRIFRSILNFSEIKVNNVKALFMKQLFLFDEVPFDFQKKTFGKVTFQNKKNPLPRHKVFQHEEKL